MKKNQIILDNYLHGYQKFLVFYLLIMAFFGSINFLSNPNSYIDLVFGLLLLGVSFILFVAIVGKKGLYISDKEFYRGISIANKFLHKEKVPIEEYSKFTHKKKEKTDLPWFLEYSFFGMFSNHNECSVYLTTSISEKRKVLISFSEFKMYDDVKWFLERQTELIELNDNA